MQTKFLIDGWSLKFLHLIESVQNVNPIPTEDWGWENHRFTSPIFRLAHIEKYELDNLSVLHITCFPHHNDTNPIFGFDVICSTKLNKMLGAFIDLSPVLYDNWEHDFESDYTRELPDWATIFSKNFIALQNPSENEWNSIFQFGYDLLSEYINNLGMFTDDVDIVQTIVNNQNNYCHQQQQNKRTFGALKSKIGSDRGREFMETILFPKI
jgi:hypothetical protein